MILKVYINGRENGRKPRKATQQRVNEFFPNLPPKTWKPMQYNDLLQALFDTPLTKKIIVIFIIWPAKIGVCPG